MAVPFLLLCDLNAIISFAPRGCALIRENLTTHTLQYMARVLMLRGGAATAERVLSGARSRARVCQIFLCDYSAVSHSGTARVGRNAALRVGRRQLSSTSVLRGAEQGHDDGELLRETPTFAGFESEVASSGDTAATSATTTADLLSVAAQTEDLAALGLGGYTPPGLVQSALEFLHSSAHLPWWASIAAATVTLRLLLFPLAVRLQVNAAKIANINPITQELHKRMVAYRNIGNKVAEAEEAAKLMAIYRKHGVNPLTTLFMMPLLQMPIFISFFVAIKGMAKLPVESMKTGGMYWFTDLTVPDPTYVLPVIACLTFISNIEVPGMITV